MKHIIVCVAGLIAFSKGQSQKGYFIDTRDGNKYETIVIGNYLIFFSYFACH